MSITGKLTIVPREGDLWNQCLKMDKDDFARSWSTSDWLSLVPGHFALFAWIHETKVLGFSLFSTPPFSETAHLLKICLVPEMRGKGEADAFWEQLLTQLRSHKFETVYLEVESSNLRAIGFYQKHDFQVLRQIKSFYSDGTDAITMQLTL